VTGGAVLGVAATAASRLIFFSAGVNQAVGPSSHAARSETLTLAHVSVGGNGAAVSPS